VEAATGTKSNLKTNQAQNPNPETSPTKKQAKSKPMLGDEQ
jgi:hypothetical protein